MNPGNRITPCDRELPNRASTFSRYQLGCHHENAHDDTKSLPGEELRTGDLLDDMRHSRVNSCAPERTVALQHRIVVSRANRCAHPNGCPRSRMVALMSEGVRPVAVRWPSGGCPVARSCVRSRSHRGKLPNRSPRNASGSTLCPPLASPAWAVCTSRTQDPGAQLPRSASPDLASKTDRPNRLHGSPGIGIPLASASPNTRGLLTGLLLTSRSAPSSRAQAPQWVGRDHQHVGLGDSLVLAREIGACVGTRGAGLAASPDPLRLARAPGRSLLRSGLPGRGHGGCCARATGEPRGLCALRAPVR